MIPAEESDPGVCFQCFISPNTQKTPSVKGNGYETLSSQTAHLSSEGSMKNRPLTGKPSSPPCRWIRNPDKTLEDLTSSWWNMCTDSRYYL